MNTKAYLQVLALMMIVMLVLASSALAASLSGGGGSLPWDSHIADLRSSIKNVIGPALIVIGIVMTFGAVMLSGEMSDFGRRGPALLAGGAGIVGADAILNMFSSGGLLP